MSVPCNGCRLCCLGDAIILRPEDRDDYETEKLPNGATMLAHKKNGECLYLGPTGCTIYEKRPLVCRTFDCADFVKRTPKALQRNLLERKMLSKEVIARGKELWRRGYRPDHYKTSRRINDSDDV